MARLTRRHAQEAVARQAARWERLTYEEARHLIDAGPLLYDLPELGSDAQVEITATWDDRPEGAVRVFISLAGLGGWMDFAPPTEDLLIWPPGPEPVEEGGG